MRSLGRYTTIGEMGLVSHAPRSATIQAEVASVLYVLERRTIRGDQDRRSALRQKLLTYFVSVMAERLSFANRISRYCEGSYPLLRVRGNFHTTDARYDPGASLRAQASIVMALALRFALAGTTINQTPAIITYLISTYSSMP